MSIDWVTFSSIATAASMAFVAYQSFLMKKTFDYNCEWQEKEKAAELAGLYKDKILPSVSYLSAVMRATGIEKLLGNIDQGNISLFTSDEFFRLTGKETLGKVLDLRNEKSNLSLLLAIRENSSSRVDIIAQNKSKVLYSSLSPLYTKSHDNDADMQNALTAFWSEFDDIQTETLNSLEFFAMHFTSKVADETLVFQSLHQTYLNIVQLLYYQIALQNTNVKDKYYTNIIELYRIWSKRDLENEIRTNEAVYHSTPVKK